MCHLYNSQQVVESVCFLAQHSGEGVKAAVRISYKQTFHSLIHVHTLYSHTVRRTNQYIDRLISKTAFIIDFHDNTHSQQLTNFILNVCECMYEYVCLCMSIYQVA